MTCTVVVVVVGLVLLLLLLLSTTVTSLFLSPLTTSALLTPCPRHNTIKYNKQLVVTFATTQQDESKTTATTTSASWIDPLLMNALLATSSDMSESIDSTGSTLYHIPGSGYQAACHGLTVWRTCLLKGRVPVVPQDFAARATTTTTAHVVVWPPEPLFTAICQVMVVDLHLPRFVHRHAEMVSVVLLTLIRLAAEFGLKRNEQLCNEETWDHDEDKNKDPNVVTNEMDVVDPTNFNHTLIDQVDNESLEQTLANQVADGLLHEFGGVMRGVAMLDQLFGYQHGLLRVPTQTASLSSSIDATTGFGLGDGIWQHTGWSVIPRLQSKIVSMPELREMLKELGQRPTAEQSNKKFHKFPPRKLHPSGSLGAQFDPQTRDSVRGITLSSSLSEMLPSEAVLLRGSFSHLRRLFWAKKAEAKLLSYQIAGWTDVPSIPVTSRLGKRRHRMPSGPGGPLIVCLDTSWSMSTGIREDLSKAVVLACVSVAHKQQRLCQVVAFSTEHRVMETGILSADSTTGIRRLLDFLAHSFGGGTDVTGALKHAIQTLQQSRNETATAMAGADILLVTDGEIPDPPVSSELMETLNRLKLQTDMEIHGLLVGRNESKPLSRICTKVHDFLVQYDDPFSAGPSGVRNTPLSSRTALRGSRPLSFRRRCRLGWDAGIRNVLFHPRRACRDARPLVLYAANYYDDEGPSGGTKRRRIGRKNQDVDDGGEYDADWPNDWLDNGENIYGTRDSDSDDYSVSNSVASDYVARVDEALTSLRRVATEKVKGGAWSAASLDKEKNAEGSCWQFRGDLQAAVERVGDGLVEREEEARLVVLAMVAREHILLLGVPGTGKSLLGRRLSKLCGGEFFQRLLTRFTTTEELFGPLSLRALEHDEYRRCTAGFLPTASVAFLDEIFKANSAILNTLLTILNERKFDNGAGLQEDCRIECVVGASNELPESDELDALYDRFLLRKEVLPVSDEGLIQLLEMSNPGFSPCDSEQAEACDVVFTDGFGRLVSELLSATKFIAIGDGVSSLIRDLRTFLREELNHDVSDRRLVKAARLLKVSAASHGRTQVDPIDCMLLQHVAWQVPEQRSAVREWLWDHITPCGGVGGGSAVAQFRLLLDSLRREALSVVRQTSGDISGQSGGRAGDIALVNSLRDETLRLVSVLKQKQVDVSRHMELLRRASDHLWLDPNESESLRQLLLPRAETVAQDIETSLIDASALELLLSDDPASPPGNLRLSVLEELWEEGYRPETKFTDEELAISMKEAKRKYDLETFRKWKSARKRLQQ